MLEETKSKLLETRNLSCISQKYLCFLGIDFAFAKQFIINHIDLFMPIQKDDASDGLIALRLICGLLNKDKVSGK